MYYSHIESRFSRNICNLILDVFQLPYLTEIADDRKLCVLLKIRYIVTLILIVYGLSI